MKRISQALSANRAGWVWQRLSGFSGWNGQLGRARRQPAAELRHSEPPNCLSCARRTTGGGRVARRNGPVARSTRNRVASIGLGATLLLAFAFPSLAADSFPPGRISFQGFLTDTAGVPFGLAAPTNATVTFRIYRSAGGTTAADILWAETQNVTIDRGHYSVVLGGGGATGVAGEPFTNNLTSVFLGADVSERYLGVRVRGFAELTPRVQFMASPFVQASRAAAGVVDPNGQLLMAVGPGGLGINLTNPATATVDVGGTVRATAFQGNGSRLTNVTTTLANVTGTFGGAQIADGAVTVAKLAPGTVPGSALADGSLDTNRLATDAINLILSQAGGVGVGGGVFSLSPTNASLTGLGFVNVGSKVIGGDRWIVKATEVTPNAPANRNHNQGSADMRAQMTCWTGTKWIVWGGVNAAENGFLGTGAVFDPALNSWTPISTSSAPVARSEFQCIWLGDKMWLYGGYNGGGVGTLTEGYYYNPTTDTWSQFNTANGPGHRARYSACWTGTEIIVFGGYNGGAWVNTGARYNPATDTWRSMASNPQRSGWGDHCFAWTGTEMIIAGGHDTAVTTTGINKAARYNPVLDNWTPMPDIPFSSSDGSSVWTGTEYIFGFGWANIGNHPYARYNPVSNTWSGTLTAKPAISNDGTGRVDHQAVWTGKEWLIVGGYDSASGRSECARFNPATSRWTPMPNVPKLTVHQPFTWTGKELLIFSSWNIDNDVSVISYTPPIEAYQYVKQ